MDATTPTHDAGTPYDAGDAGAPQDAASHDRDQDAGSAPPAGDDGGMPGPVAPTLPDALSQTGLYVTGSTTQLADGVTAYEPRYLLWSDGADKQRFLYLPPGTQIDTSNMDAWSFPVGTKVWKQFSLGGKKLETRLLWKTDQGWFRMAFAWDDTEADATAMPRGAQNVRGTAHDIPSRTDCADCHKGSPDMLLGVSAIQLSHDKPAINLKQLASTGKLSNPPIAGSDFRLADVTTWNALGYLHANCGTCHNPTGMAWDRVQMDLWLRTGELSAPDATQSYMTAVDVMATNTSGVTYRVAKNDPAHSAVIARMSARGSMLAMPPLASEIVDSSGVTLVSDWINGL
jgi:hypothetical protein